MKATSVFAGSVAGLALVTAASMASPYLSMSIEKVFEGDAGTATGLTSYRIFANIGADSRVDAVYGNSVQDLVIEAGGDATIYQQLTFGGNTSKTINNALFSVFASVEWDSYVSIGAIDSDNNDTDGNPIAGANGLSDIGINWAEFNTLPEGDRRLWTDNGSWYVTPDMAQGAEINGQVFVAQITVQNGTGDGATDVVGHVNLQGKDENGDTWNELGRTWVPAPGALALLGLAGLAGSRRRRG